MDLKDEELENYMLDSDDMKELEELEESESKNHSNFNFKNKKQNMYFDEERIKHLIVDVYQPSLKYDKDGKIIARDVEAEEEILQALLLTEDLEAEGLSACWKYLPKYVPGKGTAFNLFSILCKMDLLNYTLKMKKHRLTADIDICPDVEQKQETNYNLFFEDLEATFLKIIDEHYIKEKRKKYIELTSILMEYLVKNKNIVGKNDLFCAFRAYGYKTTDYKKFIEEISEYKSEFTQLLPTRR